MAGPLEGISIGLVCIWIKIEFNEDGSVSYKNRLMPPGTVIHTWYSMTNFQGNRIEPSLPLIDGERAYSIAVNIDYHNSESEALMLRIIFLTGMMHRRRVLLSAIKGLFSSRPSGHTATG